MKRYLSKVLTKRFLDYCLPKLQAALKREPRPKGSRGGFLGLFKKKEKPKKYETAIIFDWDDTLLPTTFIIPHQ